MPRKILIVEDEKLVLEAYRAKLCHDGAFDVATAETLDDAIDAVEKGGPFDAIAVDGCFPYEAGGDPFPEPGRVCNGVKLVLWLRGGRVRYAGPILACSSMPELNAKMVEAGATRAVVKGYGLCDALAELFPPTSAD